MNAWGFISNSLCPLSYFYFENTGHKASFPPNICANGHFDPVDPYLKPIYLPYYIFTINWWHLRFASSCLNSCNICREGSLMWTRVLIGCPKEGAVTSCTLPSLRFPSPAAPALVSSPSAPACISARWSASDEPSVGSYLVQGEAERETQESTKENR